MPDFGSKKYKKAYAELEAAGIPTAMIADHPSLYVALARARGFSVGHGFLPTHEEAVSALWFYRFRDQLPPIEGMEVDVMKLEPSLPAIPRARVSKRNMCDGKNQYFTAAKAQGVIDRSTYEARDLLQAYKCFYCGKWHIGHIIKPWLNPSSG